MNEQTIMLLLTIVGIFITLGLSINAFFLRGIFIDLNDLRVKFAEIATSGKSIARRTEKLEESEKEVFHRLNKLEQKAI